MRGHHYGLLLIVLLAAACGLKTELPSQIINLEPPSEGYSRQRVWLIEGVSDMLVHHRTGRFTIIQNQDSLSIYPTYPTTESTPFHFRFFLGLEQPRLQCGGYDIDNRLWVYDDADGYLKGYDGKEIFEILDIELQYRDPAWQSVTCLAADDGGGVFVGDSQGNTVFHYQVDAGGAFTLVGELEWGAQINSRIIDMDMAGEQLVLLVEGGWPLRRFEQSGEGNYVELAFNFSQREYEDPRKIVGRAGVAFVLDRGDTTVWELDLEEISNPESGLLVASGRGEQFLSSPSSIAVNGDKVYVFDTGPIVVGENTFTDVVVDYEKQQIEN